MAKDNKKEELKRIIEKKENNLLITEQPNSSALASYGKLGPAYKDGQELSHLRA